MIQKELLIIFVHILMGYSYGFINNLISFKKRHIIYEILFAIIYIGVYILIYEKYINKMSVYLFLIMIISYIFYLQFQKRIAKQISNFYHLISTLKKVINFILIPPLFKYIIKLLKTKYSSYIYFKRHPWKKIGKLELF